MMLYRRQVCLVLAIIMAAAVTLHYNHVQTSMRPLGGNTKSPLTGNDEETIRIHQDGSHRRGHQTLSNINTSHSQKYDNPTQVQSSSKNKTFKIETVEYSSIANLIHKSTEDRAQVTLVTGFMNIGSFGKGSAKHVRTPTYYEELMVAYKYIHNPVVAFFGKGDPFAEIFTKLRQGLPVPTRVIVLEREELWSFKIQGNVTRIFEQKGYPKFYPNTVVPGFACVTTAKFELLQYVIRKKLYTTKYIAWADFGHWRWHIPRPSKFHLPPQFNQNMIAAMAVGVYDPKLNYQSIIRRNKNWVGAGFFIGTIPVMDEFAESFLENVHYFLSQNYMAAEQQLLYGMVNCPKVPRQIPPMQTYVHPGQDRLSFPIDWYYLGWLCLQSY